MGASNSSLRQQLLEPEDIGEFRDITESDHLVIPEVPEKRKVTDFQFTIFFTGCLVLISPFLLYTFLYSDLNRFTHGYDKCGNVCGENNTAVDGIPCSGKDMTDKPFLEHQEKLEMPGKCVDNCNSSNYEIVMYQCFPVNKSENQSDVFSDFKWADVADDVNKSAGCIVLLCIIGFGLCVGMLFLFRYFVDVVVWVILVGSLLGIISLTSYFWYLKSIDDSEYSDGYTFLAILFTVISVLLITVLLCMIKRIKLVIRLFKEAITVIFGIPLILFEPLLTLAANIILFAVYMSFLLLILNSGFLQEITDGVYVYAPNGVMMFTFWFHVVICLWMSQLILGCQHMVISGAVSSFYFARDKATVTSPIYNSFYNLMRYHLGTVVFGSLLITLVTIIRALIQSLLNNKYLKLLADCCLRFVEDVLKFISKNAYIQTAMHGQPFMKSGKRAVRLLAANALDTIAVNSVGNFVLGMTNLLIIATIVGIGILMNLSDIVHFWPAILISAVVTAIIANCFFSVFETAIDTLFLCFCEDKTMNDGMERPYYMTTNLMQYIEEAKKRAKIVN